MRKVRCISLFILSFFLSCPSLLCAMKEPSKKTSFKRKSHYGSLLKRLAESKKNNDNLGIWLTALENMPQEAKKLDASVYCKILLKIAQDTQENIEGAQLVIEFLRNNTIAKEHIDTIAEYFAIKLGSGPINFNLKTLEYIIEALDKDLSQEIKDSTALSSEAAFLAFYLSLLQNLPPKKRTEIINFSTFQKERLKNVDLSKVE